MSSINKILIEELQKAEEEKKPNNFSTLMFDLSKKIKNWEELIKTIDPNDVYYEGKEKGIERKFPHVTIISGLEENVTPDEVKKLTSDITKSIPLKLFKINYFKADNFEVLKIQIESPELLELHKLCKGLPCHLKYPNFSAHLTICYLKPGTAKKYVKDIKPIIIEANTFVFSTGEKKKTEWKIKKKYKYTIELNEQSFLTPQLKLNHGLLNKTGQNIVTYNGEEVVNFIISKINDGILYLEHFLSVKEKQGYARATIEMLFSKLPKIKTIRLQCKDGILPFWQKLGGEVVNKDKNYNLVDINRNIDF